MISKQEAEAQVNDEEQTNTSSSEKSGSSFENEVIVKGIVFSASEDDISSFMSKNFGKVTRVNLLKNYDGRSKGLAFVSFETEEESNKAVAGSNIDFNGRYLIINHTKPKVEKAVRPSQAEESTTIYVGNLSFRTTMDDLEKYFSSCGTVTYTHISSFDGRSKGFGHVEFSTREGLNNALKKNGENLDGRPIKIDISESRDQVKRPPQINKGRFWNK